MSRPTGFKNVRPDRAFSKKTPPPASRRQSITGAQYSPTNGRWMPFVWDGRFLTELEPRKTRARALADARAHLERRFAVHELARIA